MKKTIAITASLFALVLFIAFTGCKKEEKNTDTTDQYSDKLTLGTGASGFSLTGEGTSFYQIGGSVQLYWRMECKNDMAGANVTINVSQNIGGTWVPKNSFPFTNPQSYGHIMVSSFNHTFGAGSFKATGVLGSTTIASVEYTVQ
jgi:hypothetical protein